VRKDTQIKLGGFFSVVIKPEEGGDLFHDGMLPVMTTRSRLINLSSREFLT